jgi:hypothetical protein
MKDMVSYVCYLLSASCVGFGIYKLFVYENNLDLPLGYGFSTNAYVESDAFNLIINSNMATAFFVLAVMFIIIGLGYKIVYNKD